MDGGNGLAKAMAGEDGYVENQVLFIYLLLKRQIALWLRRFYSFVKYAEGVL